MFSSTQNKIHQHNSLKTKKRKAGLHGKGGPVCTLGNVWRIGLKTLTQRGRETSTNLIKDKKTHTTCTQNHTHTHHVKRETRDYEWYPFVNVSWIRRDQCKKQVYVSTIYIKFKQKTSA